METNVGPIDAAIRGLLAAVLLSGAFARIDQVATSLLFATLGLVLAGTALTGKCPAYTLLGLHTGRAKGATK